MHVFEYRVVPAPRKGEKAKGAKSVADRFGVALAHVMNDMARDGWEYLRADTLPCDERVGLTGTATHFHHMLVFRRALAPAAQAASGQGRVAAPPVPVPAPHAHPPGVPPAPPAAARQTDLSDLLPEPVEERTVISPFASPGHAPAVGPAAPVVPFPGTGPRGN